MVREDLNVPLADGRILDYGRIDAAVPTLRLLHERGAKTIVLSHLGRPDGTPIRAIRCDPSRRPSQGGSAFPSPSPAIASATWRARRSRK